MKRAIRLIAAAFALTLAGCAAPRGPLAPPRLAVESGVASWYGGEHEGQRTASGARFDPESLVAAHRELPFGTRVRVTNLGNGRSVVVTIVDRGPFRRGRVLDVSRRAAKDLGFVAAGTARVRIEPVAPR